MILCIFIFSQSSLAGNVKIFELHPKKNRNPLIIKDTIENANLVVMAKAEEKDILGNYDELVFRYFFDDDEGYSDKDVDIWLRDYELFLQNKRDRINSLIEFETAESSREICDKKGTIFLQVSYGKDIFGADNIEFMIHKELQVIPEGDPISIEKSEWKRTTGEIPGGIYGQRSSYSEASKITKKRGYTISSSIQLPVDIVSLAFGFDVQKEVSTENSKSLYVSGDIPPNEKGVWVRRYEEVQYKGKIIQWSNVGKKSEIGEVTVTDYHFVSFLRRTKSGIWEPLPP